MMELFDKKFVHFMWDDELEGKKCFIADGIDDLRGLVEKLGEDYLHIVLFSGNESAPFQSKNGVYAWKFAYYDPNYEAKKAYYKEGKKVQVGDYIGNWADCHGEPHWSDNCKYRIKPEEDTWIVYLAREENGICYLTSCTENNWESVQKNYTAKRKLFIGSESDAQHWYKTREKFTEVIRAWEDGKTIQVYETLFNKWGDCAGTLEWYTDCEYRVKPECPCEDGIDSKACAGCPQDEARKQTFRPFKDCDELVEFWSKNYQTGFRPANTKPFIWVRLKVDKRERLIVAYGTDFVEIGNKAKAVTLLRLFDNYEFLDGCVIGVKKE